MPLQQEIKTQQGIKMMDFGKQSLFESWFGYVLL